MPRKVQLFHPGIGFRTLSVTGRACSLQCEHCRGRYLHSMIDASVPGSLVTIGHELQCRGVSGILVSGGCRTEGSIPLESRTDEIRELVSRGMKVNVHTGLLSASSAAALASTGADSFSIDIHASEKVIREVLHLNAGPGDYARTLHEMCKSAPGKVSPHVCAGLEGDSIDSEIAAIRTCAKEDIANLVLLRHIRTKGAPHEPRPQLSDARFLELVEHAVKEVKAPIMLGCMRPRPSADLEVECAIRGVDGIASPSPSTKARLLSLGFEVEESNLCCSLHL